MAAQPRSISRTFREAVEAHRRGDLKQAEHHCREILAIAPNDANVNYLLGIVACQSGEVSKGSLLIRKAIKNDPNNFLAHNSYGMTLKELGKFAEAEASYRKAIDLKPDFAKAYNNLGITLELQGKSGEAIDCYRRATALQPDFAEAYNNLGIVLRQLGNFEEAAANCHQAIALKPYFAGAYNNLGVAMGCQGSLGEAVSSYRRAIALKPDFAEAYNNLGIALEEQGKLTEAVESYRKAISCKKDFTKAHSNLLFTLNYLPEISQAEIYSESIQFGQQYCTDLIGEINKIKRNTEIQRRLKIGYVSADFCRHPVANFFEPLLKAHNRENVAIYLYSNVRNPDHITQRLKSEADHWSSICGKSDKDVAEEINSDGIDILVDLAGHTGDNRLMIFAYKPAPVQVTWLGYPNTTGLRAIDYRFTDVVADPLGEADDLYSEELIRLDGGFLCYQADDFAPEVSGLPCLERGYITFGSFNNLKKVNATVLKIWARILRLMPGARLLLKNKSLKDKETRDRYLKLFSEEGIATDRVELYAALPEKKAHLEFYDRVDIALDTFPYNGTTTTCEALWMGVPVVTLAGDRHSGRVGASILHHAGLGNAMIADTQKDYVELAVKLADNPAKLADIRKSLRNKLLKGGLCDASTFAVQVEKCFMTMWRRYARSIVK